MRTGIEKGRNNMLLQQDRAAAECKHIVSCCVRVTGEINERYNIVGNILPNSILKKRGLISNEQRWEERKFVRTPNDEITIGTEHWRSDEWREKGVVLV